MIITLGLYFKLSEMNGLVQFNRKINIVLWTKYFSEEWPTYRPTDCQYDNCFFTQSREEVETSDAILFHWRDIDERDVPIVKPLHQKWVLFNMEPPHHTYTVSSPYTQSESNLFESIDWVMSYRTDSDIYVPYGWLQRCRKDYKPKYKFENKKKAIAWVVSHCETSSKREVLVKELQKIFGVGVYGSCGFAKCPRNESCFNLIENKYMFYLSFENSVINCLKQKLI